MSNNLINGTACKIITGSCGEKSPKPATENPIAPVLELKGITKRFPGVLANDHIDLTLGEGEILALLGENGAGKTTLMNILYGLYSPDEGEIYIRGKRL